MAGVTDHGLHPDEGPGPDPAQPASLSLEQVVADLNPVLRGWGAYFRWGNSSRKFAQVDHFVHQRLALLASVKYGLRGRQWGRRFDGLWFDRLGVHRLRGTVRYGAANA